MTFVDCLKITFFALIRRYDPLWRELLWKTDVMNVQDALLRRTEAEVERTREENALLRRVLEANKISVPNPKLFTEESEEIQLTA